MFNNIFVQLFGSSVGSFFYTELYLWHLNWLKNKTSLTVEASSEVYLEPFQTSKMEFFPKIVNRFSFLTIFAKSFILDIWQDNLPLKPVTTGGKSSISAVWQSFEFTFVLLIFAKLFPICLLNLINKFLSTSVLCTVKSIWHCVQHICLRTKIIIVFPNRVSIDYGSINMRFIFTMGKV